LLTVQSNSDGTDPYTQLLYTQLRSSRDEYQTQDVGFRFTKLKPKNYLVFQVDCANSDQYFKIAEVRFEYNKCMEAGSFSMPTVYTNELHIKKTKLEISEEHSGSQFPFYFDSGKNIITNKPQ